jgi:hypothetical protein
MRDSVHIGRNIMRAISKAVLVAGAAGLVITGLGACSSSKAAPSAASTKPAAQINTLTGKNTCVALDANFLTALTTLKLTPGTLGTATLTGTNVCFPITGGNVTYYTPGTVDPYVQGIIHHQGSGLSLTAGATSVQLQNFTINPGNSELYGDVSVDHKPYASQVVLFDLDGSTLKPLKANTADNTAVLTGTTAHVSATAAGALDKVFSTTAVTKGLLVGVATITVNTK